MSIGHGCMIGPAAETGKGIQLIGRIPVVGDAKAGWTWVKLVDGMAIERYFRVYEMEVFAEASGGTDLCSGGSAEASSYSSESNTPSKAFDNDTSSFWSSILGVHHWIAYQFPEPIVTVGRIRIYKGDPSTAVNPKDATLYVSSNSTNGADGTWTPIRTGITISKSIIDWYEFVI